MMFKILGAAALCAHALVTPVNDVKIEREPAELTRLGKWVRSCESDSCVAWRIGSASGNENVVVLTSYFVANDARLLLQMPDLSKDDRKIKLEIDGGAWLTLKPSYCVPGACFALTPPLAAGDIARLEKSRILSIALHPDGVEHAKIDIELEGFDRVVDTVK